MFAARTTGPSKANVRKRQFAATTMDQYKEKPEDTLRSFMQNANRVSFVQFPKTRSITDKRHTLAPRATLDWSVKQPRVP